MTTLESFDILYSASQTARLPNIRKLDLVFVADALFPSSEKHLYSSWIHRHPTDGESINALLAAVMNVTDLQIQYRHTEDYYPEVLVLQDLRPPALRKLKEVTLISLAVDAEALYHLTAIGFPNVIMKNHFRLLPGKFTWFDIIVAWNWQIIKFGTVGYLDETRYDAFV